MTGINSFVYHPAFDGNHCVFRFLCFYHDINIGSFDGQVLRLMDFYFLFPHFLDTVQTTRSQRKYKNAFKSIEKPYENISNPKTLFYNLFPIQKQVMRTLAAKGFFDRDELLQGMIKRTGKKIPHDLLEKIYDSEERTQEWYKYLIKEMIHMDLSGKKGLKERTGFLEYRYDVEADTKD